MDSPGLDTAGLLEAVSERREIGRAGSAGRGPSLVVVAGIHGNEPAGLIAARRVLERLRRDEPDVRGEVVFLAGNLAALRSKVRFVDVDLNRQWTAEKVAMLRDATEALTAEGCEQRELLAALSAIADRASGSIYFLDLHTSSAAGPPFITVGDTLRNRRFALSLPLPLILGLEEQVDGALLEYLNNFGFITLGVEAGQHDAATSADHHEAVIWLSLVQAGILDAAVVDLVCCRESLRRASGEPPRVVEVRLRHAVHEGAGFRMEPGFSNFTPVRRGQPLAQDRDGPIRAPANGLLLLPLYQELGQDGFFMAGEVRPFWLSISAFLRRLHLARTFPLLPGVRRHPDDADVLIIDTRVARWYPLEIFHLFGFRKLREVGAELVVSRRRHDLAAPRRISLS